MQVKGKLAAGLNWCTQLQPASPLLVIVLLLLSTLGLVSAEFNHSTSIGAAMREPFILLPTYRAWVLGGICALAALEGGVHFRLWSSFRQGVRAPDAQPLSWSHVWVLFLSIGNLFALIWIAFITPLTLQEAAPAVLAGIGALLVSQLLLLRVICPQERASPTSVLAQQPFWQSPAPGACIPRSGEKKA
jgi:hypothetical protein